MISRFYNYLYRNWPDKTKVRMYHGQNVYLPRAGYSDLALQKDGVYELDNSQLFRRLARPNSWVIDVGTNLGLMSIPVLADCPNVRVLSFEPSENALQFLRRTMQNCAFGNRWELIPKCVGAETGTVTFTLSDGIHIEFDGMQHTGRVNASKSIQVPMTTIDEEWRRLGSPPISIIKCDVEGAELGVLMGAAHCIASARPYVLMEWNEINFRSYGVTTSDLLELVEKLEYDIHSMPHMIPVRGQSEMEMQMLVTENFLLVPRLKIRP
jgi:FkbM family methyltransferase